MGIRNYIKYYRHIRLLYKIVCIVNTLANYAAF